MPAILEAQTFPSLADFKEALREWAVEKNFTPHILDSDKQRVRAGCRSAPDCPFRIRVNFNAKLGVARVTTCQDTHTCVASSGQLIPQNIKRAETAKLSFLIKAVPQLLEVTKLTPISKIIEAVENKYGQKILDRQAQKVKQVLCKKPCRHCHQFGHSGRSCPQRPVETDADQANGEDDSSDEERPRRRSRCLMCFQTGHNRKNCPEKANIEAHDKDAAMIQNQLNTAAYAPTLPPNQRFQGSFALGPMIEDNEPDLTNHDEQAPAAAQRLAVPRGPFPPNRSIEPPRGRSNPGGSRQQRPSSQPRPSPQSTASQQPGPTPQSTTPQNPRLEAARMMQQAAKLMQEAARLNYEAARLTASAVD